MSAPHAREDAGHPDWQTAQDGPVFVVGSMRSGSTLLRLILDSHPAIAIGAETGFMAGLLATKTIPSWKHGKDWFQRIGWTEPEFDDRLRFFYAGLFARYAAEHGKRRWGEKTPFHTAHIATMAQMFPDAVFIGIVRHPGAVAASLKKSFHYSYTEALSYWTATNLDMIRAATVLGPRFMACRYEDLVTEDEPVLRELVALLGEAWSPMVLEHHRVQREKRAPRIADGFTITHDPLDAQRAMQWTQTASAADYAALQGTAALAGYFGYDPVDPTSRQPLPTDELGRAWIATGDDLAERRSRWADRVDFEARPPTLAIDASVDELAERLAKTEAALARLQTRRSVRLTDALRRVQYGRSLRDVREAWSVLTGLRH